MHVSKVFTMRRDVYAPLRQFLAELPAEVEQVCLSFHQLEQLLEVKLPVSAQWPDYWHRSRPLVRRHCLPLGFEARLRPRETIVSFLRCNAANGDA